MKNACNTLDQKLENGLFMHVFICMYLLSPHRIQCIMQGTRYVIVNQADLGCALLRAYNLEEQMLNK